MIECPVVRIYSSKHPTNKNLRIAMLICYLQDGGMEYKHVVTGDHYTKGQLGVFIPEGAIVPDKIATEMWVLGKLAGNQKNKVKSKHMDGILTEGLFYGSQGESWQKEWKVGDNVAEALGITFVES